MPTIKEVERDTTMRETNTQRRGGVGPTTSTAGKIRNTKVSGTDTKPNLGPKK